LTESHDGSVSVYDPEDAIPSAASYLAALRQFNGSLTRAILATTTRRLTSATSSRAPVRTPEEPSSSSPCVEMTGWPLSVTEDDSVPAQTKPQWPAQEPAGEIAGEIAGAYTDTRRQSRL